MVLTAKRMAELVMVSLLASAPLMADAEAVAKTADARPTTASGVALDSGATITIVSVRRPCPKDGPFFPVVGNSQDAVGVKARIKGELPKEVKTWLEDEYQSVAKEVMMTKTSGGDTTWVYLVEKSAKKLTLHFSSGESVSLAKLSKKRK